MKIHDANDNIERQDKKHIISRSKYQEIESKYHPYEKLSDVINNQYTGFKGSTFTVRTSKELDTSLRIYSEANNIPIAESIKNILEDYFQKHTVARTFFRLDKTFTVAIPITLYEIEKYINDKINCIIDLNSDIDSRLAVQRQLISKDETDYYLAVSYNIGNNYLDTYDEKREIYCESRAIDIHVGLFDIYLDHLDQSIFLKVTFKKKSPTMAQIITKEQALSLARSCNNEQLISYLENLDQANNIIDFKKRLAERETYIKTLEAQISSLKDEISILNGEKTSNDAEAQDQIEQETMMQDDSVDENLTDRDGQYTSTFTINQQKNLANAMADIVSFSERYQSLLNGATKYLLDMELLKRNIEKSLTNYPATHEDSKSDDAED